MSTMDPGGGDEDGPSLAPGIGSTSVNLADIGPVSAVGGDVGDAGAGHVRQRPSGKPASGKDMTGSGPGVKPSAIVTPEDLEQWNTFIAR